MLLALLAACLIGAAVFAVPDAQVETAPDSAGYLNTAERLRAGEASAWVADRSVLYPLLLVVHQVTGLSHYWTVSLFNLLGCGLLVWRLFARGFPRTAVATGLAAAWLFFLYKNLGFGAIYLREAVVPGVTGLHLALLVEALYGPWRPAARLGLVFAALLIAYHFKGIYLFPFVLAGPFVLWGVFRHAGVAGWRAAGGAVVAAALVCAMTFASNPNNDASRKPLTLLGVLLNSQVPQVYLAHRERLPDEAALRSFAFMAWATAEIRREQGPLAARLRVSPIKVDHWHRQQFGVSLGPEATRLFWWVLKDQPMAFGSYLLRRTFRLVSGAFVSSRLGQGVCTRSWGRAQGLPKGACAVASWAVYGSWFVLGAAVLAVAAVRRRLTPDAVVAVGLLGMSAGLAALIGLVGYTDFPRLLYPAQAYGLLALPWVVALLGTAAWPSIRAGQAAQDAREDHPA